MLTRANPKKESASRRGLSASGASRAFPVELVSLSGPCPSCPRPAPRQDQFPLFRIPGIHCQKTRVLLVLGISSVLFQRWFLMMFTGTWMEQCLFPCRLLICLSRYVGGAISQHARGTRFRHRSPSFATFASLPCFRLDHFILAQVPIEPQTRETIPAASPRRHSVPLFVSLLSTAS